MHGKELAVGTTEQRFLTRSSRGAERHRERREGRQQDAPTRAPSSASCPRARRQNHARDADRTCRTFRCIERDALQRASNAPGVGSERHVVLSSASDEADAKKIIGESSRFVSQIRRCEPEDRGGVGIDERGPSAPRIPRPRPAQQSSADELSLPTLSPCFEVVEV